MKNRIGKLLLLIFVTMYAVSSFSNQLSADKALPFDDISTSYARDEITRLYNKKIVTGTSATTFSPTIPVTRAEFITVVDRLLGLEPITSPVSAYTDVKNNAWYYGWVQAAVQLNLAKGTSATTFAPGRLMTRQEAAVWMARTLKQTSSTPIGNNVFRDGDQIADWASASVASVHKLGLMQGDAAGNFMPTAAITRQEMAMLIDRVLQNDSWSAELESKPDERIVMGWQYGQTAAEYKKSILNSNVNTLSPRWYFIGEKGTVTDKTDPSLITWAKENGKQIWPMVGNRFDQEATHYMLSNASVRDKAIDHLAAIVDKYSLDGLNIDFENVAPKDRQSFTNFIALLAEKLQLQGAVLSIDVSPDLGTDWTEAFDYAALGKHANYIVMMGYDEHYSGGPRSGPNASLPYVTNAVNKLLKVVPSKKVILAMPLYNREWTLKPNNAIPSAEFITLSKQNELIKTYSLKPVWNESLGQYVANYMKQSIKQTIWLEDGRSLIAKYNLAVNKRLGGIAYWHIGGESTDIWPSLRNAEKYYDYSF